MTAKTNGAKVTGTRDNLALDVNAEQGHSEEELARQALYVFLTRALAQPLTLDAIRSLGPFASAGSDFGQAAQTLQETLDTTTDAALEREFHDLFIGVGRGELLPYASFYLTGFLNEKPLAELRNDMSRLGFTRPDGVKEPEDHIASLCDIMSHLIEGSALGEFDIYDQDTFFSTHLKPWAGKFFADLESAKTADTYRIIGRVGRLFMTVEEEGFGMIARA